MTRSETLAFIGESEYLRESARIEARNVLDTFDVQEVLDDPDKAASDMVDDLVAVLLLNLIGSATSLTRSHAVDLGFDAVADDEIASIVSEAIDQVHADTEAQIADRIKQTDARLRADGTSEEVLSQVVQSPEGRTALLVGVAVILAGAGAGLIALIEQGIMDSAQAAFAASSAETNMPLRWHATGDGRSCVGPIQSACESRDGLEKTLPEWIDLGLPGAGNLLCSIYSKSGLPQCRCELAPASSPRAEPGVVDTSETVKAAREKANAR